MTGRVKDVNEEFEKLRREYESHRVGIAVKRVLDFIFALVFIVCLSPIVVLVALAILIDDGGPVFYRQSRCTQGGRKFGIIKFRSMDRGSDEIEGRALVQEHDLRVTRVGRFIRRSKLDELPQLINILKGDMSFVGPRPERPELIEDIEGNLPEFRLRLAAKAGLTGLAQVKGDYYTPPAEKLKWDLDYIKNFSLLQDIKIILMTIPSILR